MPSIEQDVLAKVTLQRHPEVHRAVLRASLLQVNPEIVDVILSLDFLMPQITRAPILNDRAVAVPTGGKHLADRQNDRIGIFRGAVVVAEVHGDRLDILFVRVSISPFGKGLALEISGRIGGGDFPYRRSGRFGFFGKVVDGVDVQMVAVLISTVVEG